MKNWHRRLSREVKWYRNWHKGNGFIAIHWLIMIVFAIITAGILVTFINRSGVQISYNTSLGQTNGAVTGDQLKGLTKQLLAGAKTVSVARGQGQDGVNEVRNLRDVVIARQQVISKLMQNNPQAVLLNAIPTGLYQQLPTEIQPLLEQEVELSGTVTVLHIDQFSVGNPQNANGHFEYQILANDGSGEKTFKLNFAKGEPDLVTGMRVRVRGIKYNENIAVAEAGGNNVQVTAQAAAALSGDQRTLALLVNFNDSPGQPFSTNDVANVLFNNGDSTNAFYQESSLGSVSFSGTVVGWYTISKSASTCDYNGYASSADQAAQQAGINLSNYSRRVYVLNGANCNWSGLGTVGGNPSRAWINGYLHSFVYHHELGHNLGMHHAASFYCGGQQIAISCSMNEYGDPYEVLGGSWNNRHNNGAHKAQMGWASVRNVTSSGTYTVSPLEVEGTNHVLKIPKANSNESYFVEYRQPIGFDAPMAGGMTNGIGVVVHNGGAVQTKRLDMSPDGNFNESALSDGQNFVDSVNGITITQLSHDPASATVQVLMAGATCTTANPSVSMSPLSQSGSAGQILSYNTNIRNNDSNACSNTTFNLSSALPAGWSASYSNSSVTLAPGQSTNVTLTVTSADTAADDTYTVVARAQDQGNGSHGTSANATYMVFTQAADTIAPTVNVVSPADNSSLPAKGKVNVSASASDSSGIASIRLYVDNALVKTCTNTIACAYSWNMVKVSSGSHSIKAVAADKASPANTAEQTINVTK